MIIGICGLIGSGKGTVSDYLVEEYNFEKISFADKLKDAVSELFGWNRQMLEGDTPGSRQWREEVDTFFLPNRVAVKPFGASMAANRAKPTLQTDSKPSRGSKNPSKNQT